MDNDGEVIRRYELIRPLASEKMLQLELEPSHWKSASDADRAGLDGRNRADNRAHHPCLRPVIGCRAT
jgi:hypothetical protein